MKTRVNFEVYKSSVCHRLKSLGDLHFIHSILQSGDIRDYFERGWYLESFYLLAMLDYLSRLNNLPLSSEYDDLRQYRLKKPVYPASLLIFARLSQEPDYLIRCAAEAIPEFARFNIIENEVRDVA